MKYLVNKQLQGVCSVSSTKMSSKYNQAKFAVARLFNEAVIIQGSAEKLLLIK